MLNYILPLLLTWIVELPLAIILGYRDRLFLLSLFLINLMTNPAANWVFSVSNYFFFDPYLSIFIIELGVIIVEWKLLEYVLNKKSKRLLALSTLLNTVSFLAGVLILW